MGCGSSSASSNDDTHSVNKLVKNNTAQFQLSEREEDLNENIRHNKNKNIYKGNTNNNSNNKSINDKEINQNEPLTIKKRHKRRNNVGTFIFHSELTKNLSKKEENDLNELDNLLLEDDNNNNNDDNGINNENYDEEEEESNEEQEEDDFGVLIDENINEIYQSDLSEDDIITMVSNAVSQSMRNKHNDKSLNEKQIIVIGTIIHDVLFAKHTFDLSRPIKHKSLKNVLVKVSIRKLSTKLIKETYFRGKKVTKKQLKKALKEIVGDSALRDIRVLRIEIF